MTVLRYYLMTAKDDNVEEFREALVGLAEKVKVLSGCEGVDLYQDSEKPTRFHFFERWPSVDVHRSSATQLGKEASAPVRALRAEPPVSAYLNPIAV